VTGPSYLITKNGTTTDIRIGDVFDRLAEIPDGTIDLVLTYAFVDGETGRPTPSAQLRMYRDAHVAEVLHCQVDGRLARVLDVPPPARTLFQRRVRMNSFLNRWLEYLAAQGHSIGTLEPAEVAARRMAPAFA